MAKRGNRRGRSSRLHWRDALRADAVGVALILLGGVTLLSLASPVRGSLTAAWLQALRAGLGVGVWVAPFWMAAGGLWLILYATDRPPCLGWRRPLGAALLNLDLLGLAHLLLGADDLWQSALEGRGGGLLGYALGVGLWSGLGPLAATAVLTALVVLSLFLLADLAPEQVAKAIAAGWLWLRGRLAGIRLPARVSLPTPPDGPSTLTKLIGQVKRASPKVPFSPPSQRAARSTQPARAPQVMEPLRIMRPPRIIGGAHEWRLPTLDEVLEEAVEHELSQAEIRNRVRIIERTLESFGVPAKVVEVNQGPAITQFGVEPGYIPKKGPEGEIEQRKVSVRKIEALANDLALALSTAPIRIQAPVPGRPMVGIEVPNTEKALVTLRSVMASEAFRRMDSPLKIALGQDVSGQPVVADLSAMPHLLIAGATGSGKSVCINSIVSCLLCTNTPDTLRLLMIDPKMVELTAFNGIPHLITPVVVEVERAVKVLQWATSEMDRRYRLFAKAGARNIEVYNQGQARRKEPLLPYIVIVIDELADLMMSAPEEVERTLCRLAQMARATGMHLIVATQRPSVDVVTGLIKANFPARIAFAVASQVDSRVVLDMPGAERLLGRGDMLFLAPDASGPQRLQGCFVSDRELERLVQFWRASAEATLGRSFAVAEAGGRAGEASPTSGEKPANAFSEAQASPSAEGKEAAPLWQPLLWDELTSEAAAAVAEASSPPKDELFDKAVEVVRTHQRASITLLQRRLRVGYARAARLIDLLEAEGIIGPEEGSKGRQVLISADGTLIKGEKGNGESAPLPDHRT
jgi:S-DNA-T family DNA segregation ATPase FtsK/SpoIIIE